MRWVSGRQRNLEAKRWGSGERERGDGGFLALCRHEKDNGVFTELQFVGDERQRRGCSIIH